MANQLIGTIVSISAPISLSTKGGVAFTKRELILSIQKFDPNTGQPYSDQSNTPQITFMGNKCADLDGYQTGQLVRVSFDVTGTPYVDRNNERRIINDIRGYKIEPYGVQTPQPTPAYPQQQFVQPTYGQPQPQAYPPQQATAPVQQVDYVVTEVVQQPAQPKQNDGLPL
ncbi:MAG: DUF3127 domain-containing protein [Bacteroides sp.]|nr:DUF3127 domain-containing protein [Bacteroides sp.]